MWAVCEKKRESLFSYIAFGSALPRGGGIGLRSGWSGLVTSRGCYS